MGIPTAENYVARPPRSASNRGGRGEDPEGQPLMGTGSGQWHSRLEPDGTIRLTGPAAQAEGLVSQAQQCSLVSSSGPGGKGGSPGPSLGLPKPSWLGPAESHWVRPAQGSRPRIPASSPHPSHPRPFLLPPRKVQRRERLAVQAEKEETKAAQREPGRHWCASLPWPPQPSRPEWRGLRGRRPGPRVHAKGPDQPGKSRWEEVGHGTAKATGTGVNSPPQGRAGPPLGPETSFNHDHWTLEGGLGGRRQGGPGMGLPGGRRLRPPPGTPAEVGLQMFSTCLALAPGRGMWLQRGARRGHGGGPATRPPRRTQTSQGGGPRGQGLHCPCLHLLVGCHHILWLKLLATHCAREVTQRMFAGTLLKTRRPRLCTVSNSAVRGGPTACPGRGASQGDAGTRQVQPPGLWRSPVRGWLAVTEP